MNVKSHLSYYVLRHNIPEVLANSRNYKYSKSSNLDDNQCQKLLKNAGKLI